MRVEPAELTSNSLGCCHMPTSILGRKLQKVDIKPRSNEVRALNSLNIPFFFWQNLSFKIAFLIWAGSFLVGPIIQLCVQEAECHGQNLQTGFLPHFLFGLNNEDKKKAEREVENVFPILLHSR